MRNVLKDASYHRVLAFVFSFGNLPADPPTEDMLMYTHEIFVKSFLLPFLWRQEKTIELRPNTRHFRGIRPDHVIIFNGEIWRRVTQVTCHQSLEESVTEENAHSLWPGQSREEILWQLRRLYDFQIKQETGFLIFSLEPLP